LGESFDLAEARILWKYNSYFLGVVRINDERLVKYPAQHLSEANTDVMGGDTTDKQKFLSAKIVLVQAGCSGSYL
jgi:hypothetical protein